MQVGSYGGITKALRRDSKCPELTRKSPLPPSLTQASSEVRTNGETGRNRKVVG